MATIQTAVQVMLDKLVADMQGNTPLTAEEQALASNAIAKLADNAKLEQAIVAVAESHLDDASHALSQATQANTSVVTQLTQQLNTTNQQFGQQTAKLQMLADMQPQLADIQGNSKLQRATQIRPVFGLMPIESPAASANNRRSTAIFAVYDADGTTHAARPSYTVNSDTEQARLEFIRLNALGSQKTTLYSAYAYSNSYYQNPTSRVYSVGSSAIVPLGKKAAHNDISYQAVMSSQDSLSAATTEYGGIFVHSLGYGSITKPKQNLNAIDQFGVRSNSSYNHNQVGVLYDNKKHCLLVVDAGTSLLIEKYSDDNHITSISIANEQQLQAYVNAGDFTCINFIANNMTQPLGINRYSQTEGAMSASNYSYYGYFGIYDGTVKMGYDKYSAHYRFTSGRKLEPLLFFFTSNASASSATYDSGESEVVVALQTHTQEMLAMYQFRTSADNFGYDGGIAATAINCINPYSHIGILNEQFVHNQYGLGRICKAF